VVQSVADHVSLALGNLKLQESLREQSLRDPLTGLFNRRYLEEWLDREVLRAERDRQPIGLMLIDLDHFKQVNDTFGHEAGDLALKDLADYFRRFIRGGDVACRLGGEEFLLVLPEASLAATGLRAEQLRQGIKHLPTTYQGRPVGPLTVSIGVAAFPENGRTTEALLRVADIALYRAKHQGRDQVVVGQPP
jgi:diguanylate cyclase (GGDEF)-like protein